MATKPKPSQFVVQNCTFHNNAQANEHTRAAVEAIANAAAKNAEALKAAAEALSRSNVTNQTALRIGGDE